MDDVREAPEGWIWAKSGLEAWARVTAVTYDSAKPRVSVISLDHDMGEGAMDGYAVMLMLEHDVVCSKLPYIPEIRIHTANPVGRKRMEQARDSIIKFGMELGLPFLMEEK